MVVRRLNAASVRLKVMANVDLLLNSGLLAVSAAGSAAIGFVFWWLAARFHSAEQLGLASAAISAMSLLGTVGDLGLGTFAMAAIHRTARSASLISTCVLAAALSSGLFGVAFLFLGVRISQELASFLDGPVRGAVFVAGVSACGVALVLDHVLAGLVRSSLQLMRNLSASLLKCAALGGAIVWGSGDSITVVIASTFGVSASIPVVLAICVRRKYPVVAMPTPHLLKGMCGAILGHHALNLTTQVVGLLLPLIVTALVSARANGAFFAAWMIVQVWCLGPAALATMFFPIVSKDASRFSNMMQLTLLLSLGISIVGELFLIGFGRGILSLLNRDLVTEGYAALVVLGAGIFPAALKYHFVALRRIQGRPGGASASMGVAAVFEIGCAMIGAYLGDALGLSLGYLFAVFVQALIIGPVLYRAMRGGCGLLQHEAGNENLDSFA